MVLVERGEGSLGWGVGKEGRQLCLGHSSPSESQAWTLCPGIPVSRQEQVRTEEKP